MSSFDWKENVADSIADGLTITATTTGIFYILKRQNKTTKGLPGCHGYPENFWWNSGWCPCQGL